MTVRGVYDVHSLSAIHFGLFKKRALPKQASPPPVQFDLFPETLQERLQELKLLKRKDRHSLVTFFGAALSSVVGPVTLIKLQVPVDEETLLTMVYAIPVAALAYSHAVFKKFKSTLREAGFSPNSNWEVSLAAEQKQLEETLRAQGGQTFKTK